MPDRVKVGLIGCGAIAEFLHAPDYAYSEHAEITAFCDTRRARAELLARKFAPHAKIYTDYRDLLAESGVQAVSVCLPNVLHGEVSIAAARAGLHVMVEKPMATSIAEAKKMIAAAEKAGVLLMVNQTQRRAPTHLKAKEVIESGILGKILQLTAMFGHNGPEAWSPEGTWFMRKKDARFGAMADLGVHKADLIRHLTGKEVAAIGAFTVHLEKPKCDVEDNFSACLQFTDGTIGTLAASWTIHGASADYMILHGTNGSLYVNVQRDRPLYATLAKPECAITFDPPPPANHYPGTWGVDIGGAFVRAILGLEAPFCPGIEGMKSLAVILAAEKAAATGRTTKPEV